MCERERESVCVCVQSGEGSWVLASTVLEVLQTAVHLTTDSDCPIFFCEPFSPPYRCDTSLKNVWRNHCAVQGF